MTSDLWRQVFAVIGAIVDRGDGLDAACGIPARRMPAGPEDRHCRRSGAPRPDEIECCAVPFVRVLIGARSKLGFVRRDLHGDAAAGGSLVAAARQAPARPKSRWRGVLVAAVFGERDVAWSRTGRFQRRRIVRSCGR